MRLLCVWCAFLIGILSPANVDAVRCFDCRNFEDQDKCTNECDGEFCILWKFREMSIDYRLQGCASGLSQETPSMGCRRNAVGAILCVCDSGDYCNDDRLQYLSERNTINFTAKVHCQSHVKAPFMLAKPRKVFGHCVSDLCQFAQKTTVDGDGRVQVVETRSCGQMPQYNFDFLIGPLWPMAGMQVNSCYRIELHHNEPQVTCSCTTDNCNERIPFTVDFDKESHFGTIPSRASQQAVRCHLAFGDTSDHDLAELIQRRPETVTSLYCMGSFCLIHRIRVPGYGTQYSKGCLSTSDPASITTQHRSIMGADVWLCSADFCNFDISTAESGRPHALSVEQLMRSGALSNATEWQRTSAINLTTAKNAVGGRVRAQNSANHRLFPNSSLSSFAGHINFMAFLLLSHYSVFYWKL